MLWLYGWPALRELSLALNVVSAVILGASLGLLTVLGILILRSQLEAPYESREKNN
jgi:hypothetical protein